MGRIQNSDSNKKKKIKMFSFCNSWSGTPPPTTLSRAVLIGLNYKNNSFVTRSIPTLVGTYDDVANIHDYISSLSYFDHISVITDESKPFTKSQFISVISNELQILLSEGGSAEILELYIHYSGHGTNIFDLLDFATEDVWVMSDQFITSAELFNLLGKRYYDSRFRIYIISDSCYSDSCLKLNLSDSTTNAIVTLSGSKDNQLANDSSDGGFLTIAFLNTIKKHPRYELHKLLDDCRSFVNNEVAGSKPPNKGLRYLSWCTDTESKSTSSLKQTPCIENNSPSNITHWLF